MPQSTEWGLEQLGWTSALAESSGKRAKMGNPGRVFAMQREVYVVVAETGTVQAKVSGKFIHDAQCKGDYPAVGDWVLVDRKLDQHLIQAVLPRKSSFSRKLPIQGGRKLKDGIIDGGTTEAQVIAANIDTVFIVAGLDQDFDPRRIERYLTLAAQSGAAPVLILNKADLQPNPQLYVSQLSGIAGEIPLHAVSAATGANMDSILRCMGAGNTVVFIGSSGTGKSTLINRLLGYQRQKIGPVSKASGKGRHTTTSAEIIMHPSGSMIIDTLGLRELQLWCDEDSISQTFADIVSLGSRCKFRNCTHSGEPGCAIRAAIEAGELSEDRFASYKKQMRELRRLEAKKMQRERRKNRRRR